jgi:hypothetical protein
MERKQVSEPFDNSEPGMDDETFLATMRLNFGNAPIDNFVRDDVGCPCPRCRRLRRLLVKSDAAEELANVFRSMGIDVKVSKLEPDDYATVIGPGKTDIPAASAARKATPIASGVVAYFPDALAEVARVSKVGNDQHNPGKPMHWNREKSTDEADALQRHLTDFLAGEEYDPTDGVPHLAKVAWRALALCQRWCDDEYMEGYHS